jgi:hypothetical protein
LWHSDNHLAQIPTNVADIVPQLGTVNKTLSATEPCDIPSQERNAFQEEVERNRFFLGVLCDNFIDVEGTNEQRTRSRE